MKRTIRGSIWSEKGFTVVELLIIIAVIAILAAIALPPFLQWRQNLEYRSTARDIASILRNAQSRAIAENRQYRLELDMVDPINIRRYRMTRGTLAANTPNGLWSLVGCNFCVNWVRIPTSATLRRLPGSLNVDGVIESINYNSDGTAALAANPATISVLDDTLTTRFTIEVTRVGRVSVRTGP